jgi:CheY-like chemotaxis protein
MFVSDVVFKRSCATWFSGVRGIPVGFRSTSSLEPAIDNILAISRTQEGVRFLNDRVVLCVDDEVFALRLRSLVLSSAGYQVVTATNGEAAMELLRSIQVDLVITDHSLPGLTGAQLASEIKRLKSAIPVVLFSGFPEAPAGSEHADLYITKGIPAVEFLRRVGELIEKSTEYPLV